jgi:Fe2+ or Zn2+ uptake regulation protein
MSPHDEPGLTPPSAEILRYLRAHPQAADTVDGIVMWWLPRQRYEEAIDRVQHALDDLVARGWVEKVTLVDGTVLYSGLTQQSPRNRVGIRVF